MSSTETSSEGLRIDRIFPRRVEQLTLPQSTLKIYARRLSPFHVFVTLKRAIEIVELADVKQRAIRFREFLRGVGGEILVGLVDLGPLYDDTTIQRIGIEDVKFLFRWGMGLTEDVENKVREILLNGIMEGLSEDIVSGSDALRVEC